MFKRYSILISLLFFSSAGLCDVIILRNENVLRGKVVSKHDGLVTFITEEGKVLNLKEEQIAVIEFLSDKVVEVQMNGKRIKGVEVGETKDGVIIKTSLGEKIFKRHQVKEIPPRVTPVEVVKTERTITNQIFVTNYILVTNQVFLTNELNITLTNVVEITNFITNVWENSLGKGKPNGKFHVNLGVNYNFGNLDITFVSGVEIMVVENSYFSFLVGRVGNGWIGGYGVKHKLFEWLGVGAEIGGFLTSRSGYFLKTGIELSIPLAGIEIVLPANIFWTNINPVPSIGIGVKI